MKIIAFVEARQDDVIRKILEYCGLWHEPPARGPAKVSRASQGVGAEAVGGRACEIDPDFREHLRRERQGEPLELPWEP